MSNSPFLTEDDAAEWLNISVRTLQRMRAEGSGPKFTKMGRRVLYNRAHVESWLETRCFTSTSEYGRYE